MNIDMTKPIFFDRNRVYRIYKGGLLFSDFFGDERKDNYYPEEWVASTVKALNPGSTIPLEGYSMVEHTDITLKSLIEEHPEQMTGPLGSFPLLVKLLDSAHAAAPSNTPGPQLLTNVFKQQFRKDRDVDCPGNQGRCQYLFWL